MMRMFNLNFLARFKNKAFLTTFLATVIAFVYQMCAIFEIVPPITQDEALELAGVIITALALVGIVVDPTTDGMSDSELVMNRGKKKGDA